MTDFRARGAAFVSGLALLTALGCVAGPGVAMAQILPGVNSTNMAVFVGQRLRGAPGAVGFIPTMTDAFCGTCTRLRLTADGAVKACLHGDKDATVDLRQSQDLAAALAKAGVTHELVVVPDAGHTFDFESWGKKPLSRDLRPVALAFLEKHLAPRAAK